MSALSEAIHLADTVSTPKEEDAFASKEGRPEDKGRGKSFFQAVADKMQEVFSVKASLEDTDQDYRL